MTRLESSRSRVPYDNIRLLDHNGEFLAFISLKIKAAYIRNNATFEVGDDIQLLQPPKGSGFRGIPFFDVPRDNVCVVCGTNNELTFHHTVPRQYFKIFPQYMRSFGMLTVVVLCVTCHQRYEAHALAVKKLHLGDCEGAIVNCPKAKRWTPG